MDGPKLDPFPEGLEATFREPPVKAYANWFLGLMELYFRWPQADRFAMFQDDLITCRNLRSYLEQVPYHPRTYWNLYTFPHNHDPSRKGFYPSDNMGKGAVALVFSRQAVLDLLMARHMYDRIAHSHRKHKSIDGAVNEALKKLGYRELVHNPSLVQHTGIPSTLGHGAFPLAPSFRGEQFDAMELLC